MRGGERRRGGGGARRRPGGTAGETAALAGYAAGGDSVRAAIAALAELEPLSLVDDGGGLVLAGDGAAGPVIGEAELGTEAPGTGGRSEWLRRSGDSVPAEATLAYYDPGRDYQTGLQRASRAGAALTSDRRAVAAALDAATAKALAAGRLDRLWAERRSAKLHLGWSRLGLPAGSRIRVAGRAGLWKVERWTLDRMVLTLELSGLPAAGPAAPGRPARAGRSTSPICSTARRPCSCSTCRSSPRSCRAGRACWSRRRARSRAGAGPT
jgi:hypothetical protein